MAVSKEILVDTNPQVIANESESSSAAPQCVVVQVPSGGASVYLGGSAVTSDDGFAVATGSNSPVLVVSGGPLYAVTASGTQSIRVLTTSA